jgi:hypothetical protein
VDEEARKRSVDNLQKVYTVVVSLAVAEALRRLFSPAQGASITPGLVPAVAVFSLITTIVPFYHGANRYLDATYVTGQRSAKSGALMLDFVAIFLEGILFFILAILVEVEATFFTIISGLFIFDAAWVGLTRLTSRGEDEPGGRYAVWALVNVVAAALVLVSQWSNLLQWEFWRTPDVRVIASGAIVFARTFFDYASVWDFYYPPARDTYLMPVPRPAPPPKRRL